MARSIGLAAYRALSWRSAPDAVDTTTPRPDGQLLWSHATNATRVEPLRDLGNRIFQQRPELNQLITCPPGVVASASAGDCPPPVALPSDHPASVRSFLDHWKPDLCLWTGADWMPNLITATADRGAGMILADLGEADLVHRKRWMPDLAKACVNRFETILVSDNAAAGYLRRLGIPTGRISLEAPLRRDVNPNPCSDELLAEATAELGGRPLWLAAEIIPTEFSAVLSAHRDALRFQHRLLLVMTPADRRNCSALAAQLDQLGLHYSSWSPGEAIPSHMQVLITDRTHLDLWYRLSPLTFMGGSLVVGSRGHDPMEAAALGSAILYGPNVPDHLGAYVRLSGEGAAQLVRSAAGLAARVVDLVSPDKAAKMALAGWQVATESAGLMDLLSETIQDRLDLKEAADARA